MIVVDVPALGTTINVTDLDPQEVGSKFDFTVRPEKIRITLNPPRSTAAGLNVFKGVVEEPVYSGFQSKYYVRLDDNTTAPLMKAFKQHTAFLEDGPDIEWKDSVYLSWTAVDGYLVKDVDR